MREAVRAFVPLTVAVAISVVLPVGAQAQVANSPQMQAFTKSQFYGGLINSILSRFPATVFQRCPTLVSNGSQVTLLSPVTFGADGYPNAGSWKQTFPVSGCGNDTVLNLYFSATADEKINTAVGVPGSTHADLTLQRDGVMYANTGAALLGKNCKAYDVKNTRFEGYGLPKPATPDPGPESHFRPWWETWTLVGCGATIDVPIDFVPQEKGGTQIIQPGGATEVLPKTP